MWGCGGVGVWGCGGCGGCEGVEGVSDGTSNDGLVYEEQRASKHDYMYLCWAFQR